MCVSESNGHNSSTESHYNEHDYSCGKIESPVEGDMDLATNYEQYTDEVVQDGDWDAEIEFIFAGKEYKTPKGKVITDKKPNALATSIARRLFQKMSVIPSIVNTGSLAIMPNNWSIYQPS